jgi:hypothetical protein
VAFASAGVAAGAAGAAVLQLAGARQIPRKHKETDLMFAITMPRDYADLSPASTIHPPGCDLVAHLACFPYDCPVKNN